MDLKIKQSNLSTEAYNKIKLLILNGKLKSGEKIIQEKMAEKLGISKIPLISALSILQKERLLTYVPGKGFCVRKIPLDEFHDLLDLRGVLEGLAAKKLSENMTQLHKDVLISYLESFKKYAKENDIDKYTETDKKFHFYIIESYKNAYLQHINNSFNILILIYSKGFKSDIKVSAADHEKIVQCIINNDGVGASNLMIEHFEKAKAYW
ncbi:MAG TPA: GntR family transcriptional regulator [Actinobacteria bacterium]|jgi:DNA-binding GntR family transcriptional regulator|nr:GntR family transcriptional regulator [Actinomycetota bacterium]